MTVRIMVGDALSQLAELPDESVYCVVTSPPYWGLRAYKGDPGMIGLELTFDKHLDNLVAVFREVRRVLRQDGTLWLNYGDAYASKPVGSFNGGGFKDSSAVRGTRDMTGVEQSGQLDKVSGSGLKPKDLMMMPARVAMALQADGWWLRSEIIWHKPAPMPESCRDRPSSAHEKLFLLTKSARYFYDCEAVRVAVTGGAHSRGAAPIDKRHGADLLRKSGGPYSGAHEGSTANLRNVWTIGTYSFSEAHFATFPPALVEPCIKAGTSAKGVCGKCGAPWVRETKTEHVKNRPSAGDDPRARSEDSQALGSLGGDHGWKGNNLLKKTETTGWSPSCAHDAPTVPATILDIFAGSGTVGLVADRLQRDAILIEISQEYVAMAQRRIEDDAGGLFSTVVVDDTEKSAERLGGHADVGGLMGVSRND